MWTRIRTPLLVASLALPVGIVAAQQSGSQTQDRQQTQQTQTLQSQQSQRQSGSQQASPEVTRYLAQDLRLANQGEIQLSQLAQEQAQNEEVQSFAEQMVQDHQQFLQKMDQAMGSQRGMASTGDSAMEGSATARLEQQAQQAEAELERDAAGVFGMAAPAGGGQAIQTLTRINEQLHQKKMQTMTQYLQRHQGSDFDKAYMGQQIIMHQAMIDTLETYQDHVPQEARQVLEQGVERTRQHLERAQELMKQIGEES